MAAGTIVTTFVEGDCVCIAVRVEEPTGAREYIGRVHASELEGLSDAEQKAALVAAAKAERAARAGIYKPGPKISGTVEL